MKKIKLSIILLILLLAIVLSSNNSSFIAEYVFARFLYRVISIPIGFITGIFPFSIAEIIILISPAIVTILVVLFVRKIIIKSKEGRKVILRLLGNTLLCVFIFAEIAYLGYYTLCGVNYHRDSFVKQTSLKVREYSVDELYELCIFLAKKTTNAREGITSLDNYGIMNYKGDYSEVSKEAVEAVKKLADRCEIITDKSVLKHFTGDVKPVFMSRYMSYANIVGIFIPYTIEANINVDVVDYSVPFSACHELAHVNGYMQEDEANFIAFLACIYSDSPEFVYSGYASAYVYASNKLYKEDKDKFNEVEQYISEEVYKDFYAELDYWEQFEKDEVAEVVGNVSDKVNDAYLQISGDKDGIKSYGMVVDLLLANYFSQLETK